MPQVKRNGKPVNSYQYPLWLTAAEGDQLKEYASYTGRSIASVIREGIQPVFDMFDDGLG